MELTQGSPIAGTLTAQRPVITCARPTPIISRVHPPTMARLRKSAFQAQGRARVAPASRAQLEPHDDLENNASLDRDSRRTSIEILTSSTKVAERRRSLYVPRRIP